MRKRDSDLLPTFEQRTRDYVEGLFALNDYKAGGTSIKDLPDDYTPIDLIDEEGEFDLEKVITKGIDPVTGMPRDLKIPEGDFKQARNFFDYCTNFTGIDTKRPFARGMWISLMMFGEYCPHCSDPKWLKDVMNIPVDYKTADLPEHIQLLRYGKCPKCKRHKSDMLKAREMCNYVELALEAGQRAGKSTLVSEMVSYVVHKYLMQPRLSSLCRGISASTRLYGTFIGYRMADAMALLWVPVLEVIEQSPWFIEYHKMLDHYGKQYGTEFYRKKDVYLRYATKNLELYAAGPSKRGLRGRTRFICGVDEIGWFPLEDDNQDRERAGAKGVYEALDRSLLTVRDGVRSLFIQGYNNFLPGLNINISSPSAQTDMIHTMVLNGVNSRSTLALNLPTWELSPIFHRQSPEIVMAYEKDAVAAERDYGANPPLTSAPFMDISEVQPCFKGINRVQLNTVERNINGKDYMAVDIAHAQPLSPCPPSILCLDAGHTSNSFAFCIMHATAAPLVDKKELETRGLIPRDPLPIRITVDAMGEMQPKPKHQLHFNRIYLGALVPMMQKFNVKFVFADRWNSLAILHRAMEEVGGMVGTFQYSVKYKDFLLARSYLLERKADMPEPEMEWHKIRMAQNYLEYFENAPVAHFLFQCATVRDKGNTVVKGDKFTDDIFRAFVLGISRICDPKIKEELDKQYSMKQRKPARIGAVSAGRSMTIFNPPQPNDPNARKFAYTPDQGADLRHTGVIVRISGGSVGVQTSMSPGMLGAGTPGVAVAPGGSHQL